jgi:hypothetical protein
MARRARAALKKGGAQFARFRHRAKGGTVEFLVALVGVFQDAHRQGRRHETEKFVRA